MANTATLSNQLFKVYDLIDDARDHLALARNGPESDAIDALIKAVQELTKVVHKLNGEVVDR